MAKQIIILERLDEPSDNSFRYVFWATVPAARVSAYANATATSAFKQAAPAELTAIRAGQVVEHVGIIAHVAGTPLATITAELITAFTEFQAQITAFNPTVRYGTFWDGATWTQAGTA